MVDSRMDMFDKYLNKSKLAHHEYQKEGVRWIISNELMTDPVCNVRGGFIADEMGLGKTIMMIGTMLANFVERTLIIVPPALVDQWYIQLARTTGHKSLIFHGDNKKQITLEILETSKIVITTYGAVKVSKKHKTLSPLHKVVWGRIIFDEAHHLRNDNTSLYFGARLLRANIRWLVSGTPIQNRKKDFYNLCKMVRLPASYYTDVSNLRELARCFIMKRTKNQVGIILPRIIQDKNMVVWSNDREKKLSEELHSAFGFTSFKGRSKILPIGGTLAALLKARQVCVLPRLISNKGCYSELKDAFNCSSKLDNAVAKILERKGNGNGKLVFCHFREEIDEIVCRLKAGGLSSVATFDGRTNNRHQVLTAGHEVIVLQIQTGCEGLNLQERYSEIYFISPHWNPAIEDQAVARCHRIGQSKVVHVERFEMCEQEYDTINIEKYIHDKQEYKRMIASQIL